jgi:predicted ATP-grasp superfamily ATP-dependent carboligase
MGASASYAAQSPIELTPSSFVSRIDGFISHDYLLPDKKSLVSADVSLLQRSLYRMKILLAEYASSHESALSPEGVAMHAVLQKSFCRCGHEVVVPDESDFAEGIQRYASACDMGLVIAPDYLLSRYTMLLEQYTHNLGCGAVSSALCANKIRTAKILSSHGISVPSEVDMGRRVIKPVNGCGSQGVRLSDGAAGAGEFGQEYIEGEHLSVSLVASRVTGEACLYFTGEPPLVLSLNQQDIRINDDGSFAYLGGETPVSHERSEEIIRVAKKSVQVLGCQGFCGVDVVVSDKVYVVDINPRVTTSVAGIAHCMSEEIADLLIAASKGEAIGPIHMSGRVRYDTHGKVTAL